MASVAGLLSFSGTLLFLLKHIIAHVSYSKEKKATQVVHYDPDMAIVQDADRIEALGATGIARCFIYAGVRNESMQEASDHMRTKLPDLVKRMKTKSGKATAVQRYKIIEDFCRELQNELKSI